MLNHSELNVHICRAANCGKRFKRKAELVEHMNVHHSSESLHYFCMECDFVAKSCKHLTEHSYKHKEPQYKCHCGERFRYHLRMYRHMQKYKH